MNLPDVYIVSAARTPIGKYEIIRKKANNDSI